MRVKGLAKELTALVRGGAESKQMRAWEKSARLAGAIVHPGPDVSKPKAEQVVSALREQAVIAETHIRSLTQLQPSEQHLETYGDVLAEVLVMDRAHWALHAARAMADLFGVDDATPLEGRPDPSDLNGTVETTAALTYLSQKTLGQFVPNLGSTPSSPGKLLLVAPNVLMHQRAMAADLEQFALWISLHEYTHAMQFAAAPWLPKYLRSRLDNVVRSFDSESSLLAWARALADAMRGKDTTLDRLLNERQRSELAQITAVMSVLEGHANLIMDKVPHSLLPTKRTLRRKFDSRNAQTSRLKSTVGRVSGLDRKANQYAVGGLFARAVDKKIGVDGLNRVFLAPEFVPTIGELEDADAWIDRTDTLLAGRARERDVAQ